MDPRAVTLPYDEATWDDAYEDWYDEQLREADELVEQHGERAVEMVEPARWGEEPEEVGPNTFLESLVAVRVQDLRELRDLNASLLRHHSRIRAPQIRRGPRRRGAGRPAARRTSSSTSSRGDPDLGDEPPGHRPSPLGVLA